METATTLEKIWVNTPRQLVTISSVIIGAIAAFFLQPNFPWWGDVLVIITSAPFIIYLILLFADIDTPRNGTKGFDPRGPALSMLIAIWFIIMLLCAGLSFAIQADYPPVSTVLWMIPVTPMVALSLYILFYGGHLPSVEERFRVWADGAIKEPYKDVYPGMIIGHGADACDWGVRTYSYTLPDGSIYREKIVSYGALYTTGKEQFHCTMAIINIANDAEVMRRNINISDDDILTRPNPQND